MEAITNILGQIGRGQLNDLATEKLQELVEAISDPELPADKAAGTITIELSLSLERDTGAVRITPKLTLKKPNMPLDRSLFFVTPEGNLVRENPRQRKLFDDDGKIEEINRG